jgi:hypothetical protein
MVAADEPGGGAAMELIPRDTRAEWISFIQYSTGGDLLYLGGRTSVYRAHWATRAVAMLLSVNGCSSL